MMKIFLGRKQETAKLADALSRSRRGGCRQVMISGPPGVGKSALVHAFALEAEAAGATFVFGKAAVHRSPHPFSAACAALDMLVKKCVADAPTEVRDLGPALEARLGSAMGRAMALVPALSFLGAAPPAGGPVDEDSDGAGGSALILSLLEFFARRVRGLVLFLDDIHWLDAATVKFLSHLAVAPPVDGLLLVMGFRSLEYKYPAFPGISGMVKSFCGLETCTAIELKGLPRRDIAAWLRDRLETAQSLKPLSDLCFEKTLGNPLYLTRLVDDLLDQGLVRKADGEWIYAIDRIRALGVSDNVVDLIVSRIRVFSDDTLTLLKYGALAGEIRPPMLARCTGLSPEKIEALLWKPLQLDLLEKEGQTCRFTHDRIQETVAGLIGEGEKEALHFDLLSLHLEEIRRGSAETALPTLLYHYGHCAGRVTDPATRKEIAGRHFTAARLARNQSAYGQALEWCLQGKAAFPGDIWAEASALARNLCHLGAECAYLAGDMDAAEGFFTEIDAHEPDICGRIDTEILKIAFYQSREEQQKALDIGLAVLGHLGLDLPETPSRFRVILAVLTAWARYAGRRGPGTAVRSMTGGPQDRRMLRVLMALAPTALYLSPERLFALIIARGFDRCLQGSCQAESPLFFLAFGVILNRITGSATWGRRLKTTAGQIRMACPEEHLEAKALLVSTYFLDHRDLTAAEVIALNEKGEQASLRQGDHEYYAYHAICALTGRLLGSASLERVQSETRRKLVVMARIGNGFGHTVLSLLDRMLVRLVGGHEAPWRIGEEADPGGALSRNGGWLDEVLLLYRFCAAVYCGRMDVARELEAKLPAAGSRGHMMDCYALFLRTLVDIEACKSPRKARRYLKRLKRFARENPAVYRGRYLLARGEYHRVRGNPSRALALYRQARPFFAEETDGLFEKACLQEKTALVLSVMGDPAGAGSARKKAIARYREWGLKWRHGLFDDRDERIAETGDGSDAQGIEGPPGGREFRQRDSGEESTLLAVCRSADAGEVHAVVRASACWKSVAYATGGRIHRPATFPPLPEKMITFAVATGRVTTATVRDDAEQFFDMAYFFTHRPEDLVVLPAGRHAAVLIVNPGRGVETADLESLARPVLDRLAKMDADPGRAAENGDGDPLLMDCCRRLREYMQEEKPYRDPKLNLAHFSEKLDMPRRTITDSLKTCLGQNVNTFINSYRIEAVKEEMVRPENAGHTILEIALAAGFNSKSAFNNAFRKQTGMTPSAWREAGNSRQ